MAVAVVVVELVGLGTEPADRIDSSFGFWDQQRLDSVRVVAGNLIEESAVAIVVVEVGPVESCCCSWRSREQDYSCCSAACPYSGHSNSFGTGQAFQAAGWPLGCSHSIHLASFVGSLDRLKTRAAGHVS